MSALEAHEKYVAARDRMLTHTRDCHWCVRSGAAYGCAAGRGFYDETKAALRARGEAVAAEGGPAKESR